VYVPALHHLLNEYTVPQGSETLKSTAQCLLACGGYVEAAYLGYPKGFWWKVLTSAAAGIEGQLVSAHIPVNIGGSVHDCRFLISDGKKPYGLIACDDGNAEASWLTGATQAAMQFQSESNAYRTGMIVRDMHGSPPQFLPGTKAPLIAGGDAPAVTDAYLRAMLD
jgi:hypothetical protein